MTTLTSALSAIDAEVEVKDTIFGFLNSDAEVEVVSTTSSETRFIHRESSLLTTEYRVSRRGRVYGSRVVSDSAPSDDLSQNAGTSLNDWIDTSVADLASKVGASSSAEMTRRLLRDKLVEMGYTSPKT
jgi:hypothetical protein